MGKAQLNPLSRSTKITKAGASLHGLHSGIAVGDKELF
jgi:hypothetical protein